MGTAVIPASSLTASAGERCDETQAPTRYALDNARLRAPRHCAVIRRYGKALPCLSADRGRRWVAICPDHHERFAVHESLHARIARTDHRPVRRHRHHGDRFDLNILLDRTCRLFGMADQERIGAGLRIRDSRLHGSYGCSSIVWVERRIGHDDGDGYGLQLTGWRGLPVSGPDAGSHTWNRDRERYEDGRLLSRCP